MRGLKERGHWFKRVLSLPICNRTGIKSHATLVRVRKARCIDDTMAGLGDCQSARITSFHAKLSAGAHINGVYECEPSAPKARAALADPHIRRLPPCRRLAGAQCDALPFQGVEHRTDHMFVAQAQNEDSYDKYPEIVVDESMRAIDFTNTPAVKAIILRKSRRQ